MAHTVWRSFYFHRAAIPPFWPWLYRMSSRQRSWCWTLFGPFVCVRSCGTNKCISVYSQSEFTCLNTYLPGGGKGRIQFWTYSLWSGPQSQDGEGRAGVNLTWFRITTPWHQDRIRGDSVFVWFWVHTCSTDSRWHPVALCLPAVGLRIFPSRNSTFCYIAGTTCAWTVMHRYIAKVNEQCNRCNIPWAGWIQLVFHHIHCAPRQSSLWTIASIIHTT